MEFLIEYGYIGVFIASFLAATILPFSSEVVLTGVLLAGSAYWPCMVAATLGNFLGGMSCYWLGMLGKVEWIEKYLKLDAKKLQKVQDWIAGKGSWMGFFVFLPGIGDFIAVALGFLRANVWIVAISMFLGKAIRYWVWMEFVYKVQGMFKTFFPLLYYLNDDFRKDTTAAHIDGVFFRIGPIIIGNSQFTTIGRYLESIGC